MNYLSFGWQFKMQSQWPQERQNASAHAQSELDYVSQSHKISELSHLCGTTNLDVEPTFKVSIEDVVSDSVKQSLTDRARATIYSEIASGVRHLKSRKAAGPNGIQNIIFQHLPTVVPKFITKIFNRALALNYFPIQCKGGTQ
jgi:hypothetical protein